jgi:hypothetical protein
MRAGGDVAACVGVRGLSDRRSPPRGKEPSCRWMPGRARHDGFRASQPAPVTYEPGMTARTEPAGSPRVTPDLFRGPLSGEAPDVEIENVAVTVRSERSRSTAPLYRDGQDGSAKLVERRSWQFRKVGRPRLNLLHGPKRRRSSWSECHSELQICTAHRRLR